jgi:hypothetical protein
MRRLSSKWTFFSKNIFPFVWFLGVIGAAAGGLAAVLAGGSHAPVMFLFILIPIFMSVLGYAIMKNLVFDLLDEVWDEGDSLVLVKGKQKETIRIDDILNVSSTYMVNPPRITLLLRQPCRFGQQVVFSPVRGLRLNPFKQDEMAAELLRRVHKL